MPVPQNSEDPGDGQPVGQGNWLAVFSIAAGIFLGVAVGGLWSFAVAVGRRLVPDSAGARATAIISAGIAAGTVCGMPVGAIMGDWVGWRAAFAINAGLGALIVLAQLYFLPRLPAMAAIVAWGMLFGAVPVCVQIWMFASSPSLYEAGSALMVSAFQMSLAAGAAIGGLVVAAAGPTPAFILAAVFAFAGAAVPLFFGRNIKINAPNGAFAQESF